MSVTVTDSINCIGKLNVYMNIRAGLAARQIVIHHNRITQIVVIYLKSIELDLERTSPTDSRAISAMDYSLPAVKMLISQLKPSKEVARTGGPAFALGPLIFKRVWLQVRGNFYLAHGNSENCTR